MTRLSGRRYIPELTGQFRNGARVPGRKKTQEKEALILESAGEIFAEKDFHLVLMEEVALRAGVGKGTLYRYFPTKEDLFFATIAAGIEKLHGEIEHLARTGESLAETVEAIAVGILRFYGPRRPVQSLLEAYEVRLRGPEGAEWMRRRHAVANVIAGVFDAAARRGEIREIDPRLAAELFLGMVRAVTVYRTDGDTAEDLGRKLAAVLLVGIAREEHDAR